MATPILRWRCKIPFDLCQRSGNRLHMPSSLTHNYLAGLISRSRIDFFRRIPAYQQGIGMTPDEQSCSALRGCVEWPRL
jgi:hypothetical protein